jgi:hypothetical protein
MTRIYYYTITNDNIPHLFLNSFQYASNATLFYLPQYSTDLP